LTKTLQNPLKNFLESKGFQSEYVPKGAKDGEVASLARENKAVLGFVGLGYFLI